MSWSPAYIDAQLDAALSTSTAAVLSALMPGQHTTKRWVSRTRRLQLWRAIGSAVDWDNCWARQCRQWPFARTSWMTAMATACVWQHPLTGFTNEQET